MPVQTRHEDLTLWEQLEEAEADVTLARDRLDSLEDEFERAMAWYDLEHAQAVADGITWKLTCHAIATFNLLVEHGGATVKRRLEAAFGGVGLEALNRAKAACGLVERLRQDVDALLCRVRELEEALAKRTFGVGQPGR